MQTFSNFPHVKYFSQFVLDVKPFVPFGTISVDLTPKKNLVEVEHTIGAKPFIVNLLQYYNLTLNTKFEIIFNVRQTSGLTIQNFSVDKANYLTF